MHVGTATVEIDGDIRPLERALATAQARVDRAVAEMQEALDSLHADVSANVARLGETSNPIVVHASEIDDRGLEEAEALIHEVRYQPHRADPRVDRALAALDAVRKLTKPTV